MGRLWQPGIGPTLVLVAQGGLHDASSVAATSSELINLPKPAEALQTALAAGQMPRIASLDAVLANSDEGQRDSVQPWLLAPCALQAIKASGVTFVASLLERVIEEQARGDACRADAIRRGLTGILGDNLKTSCPARPKRRASKTLLIARGAWPQYLEAGIGPDAEIFTQAPVLSSVGSGADVGMHPGAAMEQPRARSRAGHQRSRPEGGRGAGQRREPARL